MDSIPQDTPYDCDCDFPAAPGIYAIINRANQHVYVGSAKSLLKRQQQHLRDLKAGAHKNDHLQRAYDCYGSDAFLFVILEPVEYIENLLIREQQYIDTLNPEYNIARTAGSNLGMHLTPAHRAKITANQIGRKLSPETIARMSAAQLGKKQSPETVAKRVAAIRAKKLSQQETIQPPLF